MLSYKRAVCQWWLKRHCKRYGSMVRNRRVIMY